MFYTGDDNYDHDFGDGDDYSDNGNNLQTKE